MNWNKFNKFKEDVLKRKGTLITNDELYVLINRHTYSSKKLYFGRSKNAKFNSRLNYHRHWIKILHNQGILRETDKFGVWSVE